MFLHGLLDARQRTFAIGIWTTSFSVAAAIGPIFGGVLLQHYWSGSALLIGAPVMLLLIVGPRLPEFRAADAGQVDWLSAALSVLCILPAIYGIKRSLAAPLLELELELFVTPRFASRYWRTLRRCSTGTELGGALGITLLDRIGGAVEPHLRRACSCQRWLERSWRAPAQWSCCECCHACARASTEAALCEPAPTRDLSRCVPQAQPVEKGALRGAPRQRLDR